MQDYEVKGGYSHAGIEGEFTGAFRVFDDKRVVGTMIDEGKDIVFNRGKTKLVIGLMDDSQLNFWKFSPSQSIVPLVYALFEAGGSYEGRWAPIEIPMNLLIQGVEGNEGLVELEEAFKSPSLERTLDILGRIERSRTESYLDPNLIRDIKQHSPEIGFLSLNPVKSFSA